MRKQHQVATDHLDVRTIQTGRGLIRIYRRLLGESRRSKSAAPSRMSSEDIQRTMKVVAKLLWRLGINLNPATLKAIRPRGDQSFPSPVRIVQLGRALVHIYRRLLGELAKARTGEKPLMSERKARRFMALIEELLPRLGVRFAPSKLKPIRTRRPRAYVPHGGVRRTILKVMRHRGDWVTYVELGAAIIAKAELQLTPADYKHFLQKLREAVHVLRTRGLIETDSATNVRDGRSRQRVRLVARAPVTRRPSLWDSTGYVPPYLAPR